MKIGVISDTHIEDLAFGVEFFNLLAREPFADVDLILHAGDIVHPDLLHCIEAKPILAVKGNCDHPAPELPFKRIAEVDGKRIGLIHGWGGPASIIGHVVSEFKDESIDALVFGHSHTPLCRRFEGLLLFNPGSALDRREAPFHSVGILSVGESVTGQIINLDAEFTGYAAMNGACA